MYSLLMHNCTSNNLKKILYKNKAFIDLNLFTSHARYIHVENLVIIGFKLEEINLINKNCGYNDNYIMK